MTKHNPIYGQGTLNSERQETGGADPWHNRYSYKSRNPQGTNAGLGPRGYKRADEKIWEDVCDALANAYDVDASEMEVDVENSEVYLHGVVKSREEAWRAEQLTWDIPGVEKVQNNIEIKYF